MSHTSTRLLIPIPDTTDAADVPASMSAAIAVIDTNAAWIAKGTFAARPAAGTIAGKLYYATDTGAFYVTDGTTWQLVNPYPGSDLAAGVASLRTLGVTGVQAAAGNDARLSDTRVPSALSILASMINPGAVLFSKLFSTNPFTLARVGYNGSGLSTPQPNFKAGRILTPTDFSTLLAMTTPRLLLACNTTLTDTSGNAVTITNNGSVSNSGTADSGIDGTSGTAANFNGSLTWLTAPNTMKQKYGTWGCWMKTMQRQLPTPVDQTLISMWQPAGSDQSFRLMVEGTTGLLRGEVSTSGGSLVGAKSFSTTVVADDVWHFVAMTWDGCKLCIYVDGVLESNETVTLATANQVGQGPLNQSASLLLGIGAHGNGTQKYEGKISNLYVTQDVLDETAHRSLYAKKFTHGLGTQPQMYFVNVRKPFRSKTYAASDFTNMTSFGTGIAQPLMGGNMENTTWVNDFGSLGLAWGSSLADATVPYPFQGQQGASQHGAFHFAGAHLINGSDTGLPSGASPPLSYGVWVRCATPQAAPQVIFTYGVAAANAGRGLWIDTAGVLWAGQSAQLTTGAVSYSGICDGQWHFVVVAENNSGTVGSFRKMWVDGQLVACGTTTPGTITLGGALGAQLGRDLSSTNFFTGDMAGFFIGGSVLIGENVRELFMKINGSSILADRQPMDPSNFIERADTSAIYWIGDDLEPTDQVEVYVV